jgi:hypothetical protein
VAGDRAGGAGAAGRVILTWTDPGTLADAEHSAITGTSNAATGRLGVLGVDLAVASTGNAAVGGLKAVTV